VLNFCYKYSMYTLLHSKHLVCIQTFAQVFRLFRTQMSALCLVTLLDRWKVTQSLYINSDMRILNFMKCIQKSEISFCHCNWQLQGTTFMCKLLFRINHTFVSGICISLLAWKMDFWWPSKKASLTHSTFISLSFGCLGPPFLHRQSSSAATITP